MPDASHGYPCGFKGDERPLGARIFAVVDAYDAITSDRPYRKARPHQYALEEIRRNGGSQFDPQVVEALLRLGISDFVRHEDTTREHAVPLSYAAM